MAVTMRMIAEKAGVSVPAVSWVLNGRDVEMRISPERAKQIRAIAKELNYIPNAAARSMMTNRTHQVGVFVRTMKQGGGAHPRAMETIMGLNAGLEASGNVMVVIPVTGDTSADKVESRVFRERLLDGLIMLEDVPPADESRALAMVKAAVWVNANVWQEHNCIRRDEFAAGQLVARELFKLGYRKFIYADKEGIGHYSENDRLRGVESFVKEQCGKVEFTTTVKDKSRAATDLAARLRGKSRDVALIACDSYIARFLQSEFSEQGLRPGHDFAFACCDDTEEFHWTWRKLARVGFDRFSMGKRAAEMLLRRLANPDELVPSEHVGEPWIPGSTAGPLST